MLSYRWVAMTEREEVAIHYAIPAEADDRMVLVRNSNQPDAGTLTLTRGQLRGLVDAVKAGELDDLG